MKDIFIGKSPYEVEDLEKYEALEPVWKKLSNTPEDPGITPQELYEDIDIEPETANKLTQELAQEFIQKFLKSMKNPLNFFKLAKDSFYEKNLANCWAFDKIMLLVTRVKGGNVELPENPVFDSWKEKWYESRGM